MKILIIGAGRMGIRHANGALSVEQLKEMCIADISEEAIENAKIQLSGHIHFSKALFKKIDEVNSWQADFVIIAATAADRLSTCKLALACNPKYILIEKPLGQSAAEIAEIVDFFSTSKVQVFVNFVLRMYPFIKQLKSDINTWQQFNGNKTIMFNGGALGIGANGIHYLDLLSYLLDAHRALLVYGEIDSTTIPSGRGVAFNDFGGCAYIKLFDKKDSCIGNSILSLSSTSSVFGGWDIVGSHARIRINETEGTRTNILRKPDSILTVNRYGADYLPPETLKIATPLLSDLTKEWIESMINGIPLLPTLQDSLKAHELMFEWLSLNKSKSEVFPIT